MLKKEAADGLGWETEKMKEKREEMLKSLYISLNRIKPEYQVLKQCQLMTVKSIYKGEIKESIRKNQRVIDISGW